MAVAGDAFAVKLANGQYAAVRVLKVKQVFLWVKKKYCLVYCSTYLDRKPPRIEDPRVRKPLRQRSFSHTGARCLLWLPGMPSSRLKHIGHIPPSKAERAMRSDFFGGGYEYIGNEALMEWRWIHDREKLEEETRKREEKEERERRRAQKPKYMMQEARFWSLINALDWRHTGNDRKVIEPVLKLLSKASVREIKGFEERLAYCLYRLDTREHARRLTKRASDYLSPDQFLYSRCACVANGKRFYEHVRLHPKRFPKDLEFESLLNLAADAYERKTGEDFDYESGCSYESFSNVRGWESRRRPLS